MGWLLFKKMWVYLAYLISVENFGYIVLCLTITCHIIVQ